MKRAMLWASAATVIAIGTLSFTHNKTPHSAAEITLLSDRLMEFGAVDFVHGSYTGKEHALFECVRKGQPLSAAQSIRYRTAYQQVLLDKQGLFTRLDECLTDLVRRAQVVDR